MPMPPPVQSELIRIKLLIPLLECRIAADNFVEENNEPNERESAARFIECVYSVIVDHELATPEILSQVHSDMFD